MYLHYWCFFVVFYRYARMPEELLPTVIISLRARVEEGFPFKSDQTSLLVSFVQIWYLGLSMMSHISALLIYSVWEGCGFLYSSWINELMGICLNLQIQRVVFTLWWWVVGMAKFSGDIVRTLTMETPTAFNYFVSFVDGILR